MKYIKQILFALFILIFSGGFAQIARAECPSGKSPTTITNNAGKVIDICVSDAAIDHIGGPSGVVVPAVCPCWTAESIDEFAREMSAAYCNTYGSPAGNYDSVIVRNLIPPTHNLSTAYCDHSDGNICISDSLCRYIDEVNFVDIRENSITREQHEACKTILLNSAMWTLNCSTSL